MNIFLSIARKMISLSTDTFLNEWAYYQSYTSREHLSGLTYSLLSTELKKVSNHLRASEGLTALSYIPSPGLTAF